MTTEKRGLNLDRVVLLGRTLEEYRQFFGLDIESYRGRKILDIAAGVSSFTAQARGLGFDVTAFDRIYGLDQNIIREHCEKDLAEVTCNIADKPVYKWDFYKTAEGMRAYRERAYRAFLEDYESRREHYVQGELPRLPFSDDEFALTLVSYLLFVYEEQLSYDFHKQTVRELLRVTAGEVRIYPIITFEAAPSQYLARIRAEADFADCAFEVIATDFEFLRGSNCYLRITRKSAGR